VTEQEGPEAVPATAIAMWDFSWLERRYPGGGYEDWDRALGELADRGYDAVRIDAFPHLVAAGAEREWRLLPCWTEHDWGAPFEVDASVGSSLAGFLAASRRAGIRVAVSSWFRDDTTHARMALSTPEAHAEAWISTLRFIEDLGHLDDIMFVDLANEFALPRYNPYVYPSGTSAEYANTESRATPRLQHWMRRALGMVKAEFPDLPGCFSFCTELHEDEVALQDVSYFDLLELHIWMTHSVTSDFNAAIGYDLGRSPEDPTTYEVLAEKAVPYYETNKDALLGALKSVIEGAAQWSVRTGLPLVTTESWGVINYKDGDGLDWGWVKESCAFGVEAAAARGRWASINTSNFCGPQFRGMWDDVAWHRAMTDLIHASTAPPLRSVGR
jgi:sugar phosphate isomerase/epimerase